MDELLSQAEKIIQISKGPEQFKQYLLEKNKILFGSFALIITNFQIENQKLLDQIEKIKTNNSSDLKSNITKKLQEFFSQFGYSYSDQSIESLLQISHDNIKEVENDLRVSIERYKSNIKKHKKQIQQLKQQYPQPKQITLEPQDQIIDQIKKNRQQIETIQKQITKIEVSNQSLKTKISECEKKLSTVKRNNSILVQRKNKVLDERDMFLSAKNSLSTNVSNLSGSIQVTLFSQKFGCCQAKSSQNMQKILNLQETVKMLNKKKDYLENRKKKFLIQMMHKSHHHIIMNRIAPYV